MNLTASAEIIVALSGAVGAIVYLYKKVVSPIARTLVTMEEAVPVLTDIAHEFKNNSGSTLKDHLDKQTADIKKTKHDATQTRAALGLYVHSNNKRLTAIEESIKALTEAVTALSLPKPRKARTTRVAVAVTSDPEEGGSDAGS